MIEYYEAFFTFMPVLTRQRKVALQKKTEGINTLSWVLLLLLTLLLLSPVLTAEGAFYNDATFPYSQNSVIGNLSANEAFTLIEKGLKGGGATSPLVQTGNTLNFIISITNFLLSFYFIVAVGVIVYQGILVLLSRSSEEKRKGAFKVIVNIAIATAVVMLSYIIVRFVVEFFRNPGMIQS